jgi:hypothetical protein
MYVIVNFLRSSPSRVRADPAIGSLLADSSRRMSSGTLVWTALVLCRALVVFGVGCDAVWRLGARPLRHFWLEVGLSELVTVVVGVCCKPKGVCGVVDIFWRSCQLNTNKRTFVAVS